jgi:hypothetical protein
MILYLKQVQRSLPNECILIFTLDHTGYGHPSVRAKNGNENPFLSTSSIIPFQVLFFSAANSIKMKRETKRRCIF